MWWYGGVIMGATTMLEGYETQGVTKELHGRCCTCKHTHSDALHTNTTHIPCIVLCGACWCAQVAGCQSHAYSEFRCRQSSQHGVCGVLHHHACCRDSMANVLQCGNCTNPHGCLLGMMVVCDGHVCVIIITHTYPIHDDCIQGYFVALICVGWCVRD